MKCDVCGAEITATDTVCPFCRAAVTKNVESQPVVEQSMPTVEPISVVEQQIPAVEPVPVVEQQIPTVEPITPTVNPIPVVNQSQQPVMNVGGPKKKGKGFVTVLVIALVAVLGFLAYNYWSGSVDKDHKAKFTQAKNNLKEAESFTAKMTLSASMPILGGDMAASIVIKNEGDKYLISLDASQLGALLGAQIPEIKMYMDKEHVYIPIKDFFAIMQTEESSLDISSFGFDSDWLVVDLDDEDLSEEFEYGSMFSDVGTVEEILLQLFDENHLKYIGAEGSIKHYKITLDKDWFKKIFDTYIDSSDYDKELKNELINSWDLIETSFGDMKISYDVYFNEDTNYITKLELDILDMLKSMPKEYGVDASQLSAYITECKLTIDFSDYNSTVVDIPSAAKKGMTLDSLKEKFEAFIPEDTSNGLTESAEFDVLDSLNFEL